MADDRVMVSMHKKVAVFDFGTMLYHLEVANSSMDEECVKITYKQLQEETGEEDLFDELTEDHLDDLIKALEIMKGELTKEEKYEDA